MEITCMELFPRSADGMPQTDDSRQKSSSSFRLHDLLSTAHQLEEPLYWDKSHCCSAKK